MLIDRAHATKVVVMLGNFEQPFVRDVFASSDVFQKRHDVRGGLRAAEGNQEQGIRDVAGDRAGG